MTASESEAATLWCPFARGPNGNRVEYGSDEHDPQYGTEMATMFPCIASRCAAWRWSGGTRVVWKDNLEPVPPRVAFTRDSVIEEPISGDFCGLAGRPS